MVLGAKALSSVQQGFSLLARQCGRLEFWLLGLREPPKPCRGIAIDGSILHRGIEDYAERADDQPERIAREFSSSDQRREIILHRIARDCIQPDFTEARVQVQTKELPVARDGRRFALDFRVQPEPLFGVA